MDACIVNIGDELLIGQVVNTNASFIAENLSKSGIHVKQIVAIADDPDAIRKALNDFSSFKLVVFTGGLGPTRDDLTKEVVCSWFDDVLIENLTVSKHIESLFAHRNLPALKENSRQAFLPSKAVLLHNPHGTASGMIFLHRESVYCFLPGVPYEMKHMLTNELIPYLQKKYALAPELHRTILTQGMGESFIAERLKDFEDKLPAFVKLAYLPSPGIVRLRLSLADSFIPDADKIMNSLALQLKLLVSEWYFGENEDTLETLLGGLLLRKGYMLTIAESCTGGYLSSLISAVPGCSKWFKGGVVAYSNELKMSLLGVSDKTLQDHGAVSEQTVIEMALGASERLNSHCCIAVSGIAGPDGGTKDKPVGTIWIAVKTPNGCFARKVIYGNNRERNIRIASLTALFILFRDLSKQA